MARDVEHVSFTDLKYYKTQTTSARVPKRDISGKAQDMIIKTYRILFIVLITV
jgi:hypothetical protein